MHRINKKQIPNKSRLVARTALGLMIVCCLLPACHKAVVEQEDKTQDVVAAPEQADMNQPQDKADVQKAVPTLTAEQRKKIHEMKQLILDIKLQVLSENVIKNIDEINALFEQGAHINKAAFLNALQDNRSPVLYLFDAEKSQKENNKFDVYVQHLLADSQLQFSPICEAVRVNNMYVAEKLKNAGANVKEITEDCVVEMLSRADSASPLLSLGVEENVLARALANVDDEYLTGMLDRFNSVEDILKAGVSEERLKGLIDKKLPLWVAEKNKVKKDADEFEKEVVKHQFDEDAFAWDNELVELTDVVEEIEERIAKINAAGYGTELTALKSQTKDDDTDKSSTSAPKEQEEDDTEDSDSMMAENEDTVKPSRCKSLFGNMEDSVEFDYEANITNEDAIRNCLKNGAKVNERNALGQTPIFEATQTETIDLLIENGANINAKDKQGQTPIMIPEVSRYKVRDLIEKGAEVDIRDKNGQNIFFKRLSTNEYLQDEEDTILEEIIRQTSVNYEIKLFELILSKGGDINVKDKKGRTPLFYLQAPEGVAFFTSHGLDVNAQDNDGQTALMVTHNPSVAIALLAAGADVDMKDKTGQTVFDIHKDEKALIQALKYPFHHCKVCGTKMVSDLVSHGFDINGKDLDNKTALEIAMTNGDYISTISMFKAGAKDNTIGKEGDPILFDLMDDYLGEHINGNNYEEIKRYLESLEDQDSSDYEIDVSDFKEIFAKGANVNLRNREGMTPLMMCNAKSDFVQMLIDAGADVNAVDNQGRNALYYAGTCMKNDKEEKEVLDILLKSNALDLTHHDNHHHSPLVTHDLSSAYLLIDAGFDINEKYEDGTTPFFMVLANQLRRFAESRRCSQNVESKSLTELIAKSGAQINEQDGRGRTMLSYMLDTNMSYCWLGSRECNSEEYMLVSALMDNHADINQTDHEGRSPLMLAKCLDTAQLLVKKGASAPITEGNWKLLLDRYEDCIKRLQSEDAGHLDLLEKVEHLELLISHFESSH